MSIEWSKFASKLLAYDKLELLLSSYWPDPEDSDTPREDAVGALCDNLQDMSKDDAASTYETMIIELLTRIESVTIAEFLTDHVPTECLHYFEHPDDGSREWWEWKDGDAVVTVKSLVERAASLTEDMLDVDYKPVWMAVAKQCLVWAFG